MKHVIDFLGLYPLGLAAKQNFNVLKAVYVQVVPIWTSLV